MLTCLEYHICSLTMLIQCTVVSYSQPLQGLNAVVCICHLQDFFFKTLLLPFFLLATVPVGDPSSPRSLPCLRNS